MINNDTIAKTFDERGVVHLPQALSPEVIDACRTCFMKTLQMPNVKGTFFSGVDANTSEHFTYNEGSGYRSDDNLFKELLETHNVFGKICHDVWGGKSNNVYFYDHEIFYKKYNDSASGIEAKMKPTPFHQDTSVIPFTGKQLLNIWIPLDDLPKENSLKVVAKSHYGPRFKSTNLRKRDGLKTNSNAHNVQQATDGLPVLPAKSVDPNHVSIDSFQCNLGDTICLHPGCIHGAGTVNAKYPTRRTLVLRFFGDDCVFASLPKSKRAKKSSNDVNIKNGDKFIDVLNSGIYNGNHSRKVPFPKWKNILSKSDTAARKTKNANTPTLFKVTEIIHRPDNMSFEEFSNHWLHKHAPIVAKLPGLIKYVQSHANPKRNGKENDFDGIAELWFENEEAVDALKGTMEVRKAKKDEPNFVNSDLLVEIIGKEHIIVDGPSKDKLKQIHLVKFRSDMNFQTAQEYWKTVHGPMCAEIPGLARYTQSHLRPTTYKNTAKLPTYDGVTIIWWDDLNVLKQKSIAATNTVKDQLKFMDEKFSDPTPNIFATEYIIVDKMKEWKRENDGNESFSNSPYSSSKL